MPLTKDFLHHLHELMVEVSDSEREQEAAYKRKLIFDAQKTNNQGAVLQAYREAALHAFINRVEKTIDKYIEALGIWGIALDDSIEREMLIQIAQLMATPKYLSLPPGLKHAVNLQAIQSSYAMEMERTTNAIRRKAANRLRETKAQAKQTHHSIKAEENTKLSSDDAAASQSKSRIDHPRVFISYSWDSEEHRLWVKNLASRLRSNGVNVILDEWHLELGADRTLFMERAIAESDFVLVICTPIYGEKGNRRSGGVGYEATVITSELADDVETTKFIPILRIGEWTTSSPRWLKARMGADLRQEPPSEVEFDKLLRTLHRNDSIPPIGEKPRFEENPMHSKEAPRARLTRVQFDEKMNVKEMELLWNAVKDPDGHILHSVTFDGEDIRSNNRHFLLNSTPRSIAEWRGALKKLEARGMIEALSEDRDFFRVSDKGYAASDALSEFARWRVNTVIIRAHYMNAPTDEITVSCTDVVALPSEYYEYQIRKDSPIERSLKEPRTLLVEGVQVFPDIKWNPTDAEFVDLESGKPEQFRVDGMQFISPSSLKLPISN